jgi:hypothetical protein
MLDLGARQGAVHFHIVDAGNAEDRIDAIGFKQADESRRLRVLDARTCSSRL